MSDEQSQDDAPIIVPGGGVHNDHWCEPRPPPTLTMLDVGKWIFFMLAPEE
jgi:hypothetical protein